MTAIKVLRLRYCTSSAIQYRTPDCKIAAYQDIAVGLEVEKPKCTETFYTPPGLLASRGEYVERVARWFFLLSIDKKNTTRVYIPFYSTIEKLFGRVVGSNFLFHTKEWTVCVRRIGMIPPRCTVSYRNIYAGLLT